MADPAPPLPIVVDHNPSEFDSLLDSQFFPSDTSNLIDPFFSDFRFGSENGDFDLTFDDLDDLDLPSDSQDFLLSDYLDGTPPDCSPVSGGVTVSNSGGSEVSGLNYVLSESSQNSGAARVSNSPSQDSGDCLSGGRVSSQGSENLRPDSGNCERDVSSQMKVEVEEIGNSNRKRKKEQVNESISSKYRRSLAESENVTAKTSPDGVTEDDDEKRKARLMRNRESAQLSRQRKKHYVEELEDKVRAMQSTIADLNSKMSFIMAENLNLRHQLGSSGMVPPPPPPTGMYPNPTMVPMPYPWMPYAPYVVKPQGSQVPLVPIPRLKTKQPVPASKPKKSENKTKKVASVSFLGLLFFILLFGGLAPTLHLKYGGMKDQILGRSKDVGNGFYDLYQGKLLTVKGHSNGSDLSRARGFSNVNFDVASRINCERAPIGLSRSNIQLKDQGLHPQPGSDKFLNSSNASEALVASLYVPRNDKLVKIDGNLVIHSVLASEKAMASHLVPEINTKETALAIPGGRLPHLFRNPTERQKALGSSSTNTLKDHYSSSKGDGKQPQWFREGLAGPLLSSGMCNEVFHFDVLPTSASGVIVPASSVANISAQNRENVTYNMGRNRRILHGLPVAVKRSNRNVSEESMGRNSQQDGFQGNKSVSSMVVSVLIDPREVGDMDNDGMISPKSLSRIFVVVLLDSVKYVTYSCMLPSAGPNLVIT